MKTDELKPRRLVYKTDDGIFCKDRFMGYVFYQKDLLIKIGKNADVLLLDAEVFKKANDKKEPIFFKNREALLNIVLSMVQPFLLENHRSIVEQSIKISNENGKTIDLGYPNSVFISINDPSGNIINVDPMGFFGFVYNGVFASLSTTSEAIRDIFCGSEAIDYTHFNKVCHNLAKDITDNIAYIVFQANSFGYTFQAEYDSFSWYTSDKNKAFACNFKIEFINFRNFNKDFDESKVCRLFSLSKGQRQMLMGCSIKIYLENTIYMSRIEDQTSKPE